MHVWDACMRCVGEWGAWMWVCNDEDEYKKTKLEKPAVTEECFDYCATYRVLVTQVRGPGANSSCSVASHSPHSIKKHVFNSK